MTADPRAEVARPFLAAALLVVIALGGCTPSAASAPTELTVYAASSLSKALDQVKEAYARVRPGVTLTISTDSSAALAGKIEQGAAVDVFLSADPSLPERLESEGFVVGPSVAFAGNRLTIIVPSDNPAFIASAADLGKPGVRIIAAGDHVPITGYAERLVAALARLQGYPGDFPDLYAENIVTSVDSVAAIVSEIELGEGDAAIVYTSDATSGKVLQVEVPDVANLEVTYRGVVTSTQSSAESRAFLAWLASEDGRSILGNFGFLPPSK